MIVNLTNCGEFLKLSKVNSLKSKTRSMQKWDDRQFNKLRRVFEAEQSKFSEVEDSIHAKMGKYTVKPTPSKSESTPLLNADNNEHTYQQEKLDQLQIRDYEVDVYKQNQHLY